MRTWVSWGTIIQATIQDNMTGVTVEVNDRCYVNTNDRQDGVEEWHSFME